MKNNPILKEIYSMKQEVWNSLIELELSPNKDLEKELMLRRELNLLMVKEVEELHSLLKSSDLYGRVAEEVVHEMKPMLANLEAKIALLEAENEMLRIDRKTFKRHEKFVKDLLKGIAQ